MFNQRERSIMELDNVLKKLRKLKKLYEGAKAINSESEAATAASLIQKLLAEYNITMDEGRSMGISSLVCPL